MAKEIKDPVDILLAEVERRKKLPGMHNYSYGRLISDTTEEERRELIAAGGGLGSPKKKIDTGKREIVCKWCGKTVVVTDRLNRKYCGMDCMQAAARARDREKAARRNPKVYYCQECGLEMPNGKHRRCEACREARSHQEGGKVSCVCNRCGTPFQRNRRGDTEYCSSRCRGLDKYEAIVLRKVDGEGRRICPGCSALIPEDGVSKYCSIQCRRDVSNLRANARRFGVILDV